MLPDSRPMPHAGDAARSLFQKIRNLRIQKFVVDLYEFLRICATFPQTSNRTPQQNEKDTGKRLEMTAGDRYSLQRI